MVIGHATTIVKIIARQIEKIKSEIRRMRIEKVKMLQCVQHNEDDIMVSYLDHKNSCVLDSGCTFHMCPRKEWIQILQLAAGGHVHLGDDIIFYVIGIRNIQVEMFDGLI